MPRVLRQGGDPRPPFPELWRESQESEPILPFQCEDMAHPKGVAGFPQKSSIPRHVRTPCFNESHPSVACAAQVFPY